MFAARANQENVIYEQQTAAAAKSLNQGAKQLPPKTPTNKAPKTPFRVPLNDENAAFGPGKTGGRGKQDGLFGDGTSGKVDKSAFITPAGPRNRAPLGNKTTNAKANVFKTPAPVTQDKGSAKHTSPRLRRAKIKVHEAQAEAAESEDDLPEIEHMPSREVPLPDHPDEWPHDRTYPQFEGNNLTRGWWSEFSQKGDGDDTDFSDFEEKLKSVEKRERSQKQPIQQLAKKPYLAKTSGLQKTTTDPLKTRQPPTLSSRNAASALSAQAKTTRTPSFAAPTATAKSRLPSTLMSKKLVSTAPPVTSNPRHGAARVASNSTLGYSKGRAVSSNSRQAGQQHQGLQTAMVGEKKHSPMKTSLDDLFDMTDSLHIHQDGDEDGSGGFNMDDDELADFQLNPVEL